MSRSLAANVTGLLVCSTLSESCSCWFCFISSGVWLVSNTLIILATERFETSAVLLLAPIETSSFSLNVSAVFPLTQALWGAK